MKERAIIFSAPMVRAILEGRKTQTRRVLKSQPGCVHDGEPYWAVGGYRVWSYRGITDVLRMGTVNPQRCPFGTVGERLWVRETWGPCRGVGDSHPIAIADATYACFPDGSQKFKSGEYCHHGSPVTGSWPTGYKWRPSIHMPRWASRITLEIAGVKVERLNEITGSDCANEGICGQIGSPRSYGVVTESFAREQFQRIWESINGPGSWDANPWVWVIEFRLTEPRQ